MKKKTYIAPSTEKFLMSMGSLLAGSPPEGETDDGKGPTGPIDPIDGDESDSKRFNAWSNWDE